MSVLLRNIHKSVFFHRIFIFCQSLVFIPEILRDNLFEHLNSINIIGTVYDDALGLVKTTVKVTNAPFTLQVVYPAVEVLLGGELPPGIPHIF